MQLANLSQAVPELTRPSATLFFTTTLGMLVFGIAGTVGLIGVLRDASGPIAARTLQTVATVMLTSLTVSLLAGL